MKNLIIIAVCFYAFQLPVSARVEMRDTIDLAGEWYYRLHGAPQEIPGEGYVQLPGSLDTNGRGIPLRPSDKTASLSRRFVFEGPVSYFKTITVPEDWKDKELTLFIERTRPTTLIIDGDTVGSISYLSAPHVYNFGNRLSPGSHKLEIIVNNRDSIPVSVRKNSNSATEYTQTNWNGMTGEIYIEADAPQFPFTKSFNPSYRLKTDGTNFTLAGKPVFLRGTVNNCVFPLTGFPPTDEDFWTRYFETLSSYGLNHIRFHTWCPPEAAFNAADKAGFFLQIELPVWGELDRDFPQKNEFLIKELEGILGAYAHHPSFALFCVGNELWGDISLMREITEKVKEYNPDILVTFSSDLYSGFSDPMEGEDFIVASRIGRADDNSTQIRGSFSFVDDPEGGIINSTYPNSAFNYRKATYPLRIPVISHEVGQYQSYPDFSKIDSYTGILQPDNLKEFRRRAEEYGTLKKSDAFHKASSEWAAKLYKAEIESQLRTPGIAGFQLMSVQDHPGEGTALVGILDPLMNKKEGVDLESWIESCGDLVFLAEMPKYCYVPGEIMEIPVKIANYTSRADTISQISWETSYQSGTLEIVPSLGLQSAGTVRLWIPPVDVPRKYTFTLSGNDGATHNHYDFWVYPKNTTDNSEIFSTSDLGTALLWLNDGKKVLLTPDSATVADASIQALFTTDFWNYRMFRTLSDRLETPPSPGTLGLLVDATHPAFQKFPTSQSTDWQWYSIIKNSRPLIIDRLPKETEPIIEVIDNVERNFRLALMLECAVGKGKLMILSVDSDKIREFPEGEWLLQSVKDYMASKDFKPKINLSPSQLTNLLTKPSNARLIRELKNETYDPHWD